MPRRARSSEYKKDLWDNIENGVNGIEQEATEWEVEARKTIERLKKEDVKLAKIQDCEDLVCKIVKKCKTR